MTTAKCEGGAVIRSSELCEVCGAGENDMCMVTRGYQQDLREPATAAGREEVALIMFRHLAKEMADPSADWNEDSREAAAGRKALRAAADEIIARLVPAAPSIVPEQPAEGPLNRLARELHAANATWWHDPATGERLTRNKGELLCLIHSEISEAMEGERKNLMDDKLPHRRMAEVELGDALIRIFDYAGAFGYDLDGAVAEKRAYNDQRADHKPAARLAADGKKW